MCRMLNHLGKPPFTTQEFMPGTNCHFPYKVFRTWGNLNIYWSNFCSVVLMIRKPAHLFIINHNWWRNFYFLLLLFIRFIYDFFVINNKLLQSVSNQEIFPCFCIVIIMSFTYISNYLYHLFIMVVLVCYICHFCQCLSCVCQGPQWK